MLGGPAKPACVLTSLGATVTRMVVLGDITNTAKVLGEGNQMLSKTGAKETEWVRLDESSPGHAGWEVRACANAQMSCPVSIRNFKGSSLGRYRSPFS